MQKLRGKGISAPTGGGGKKKDRGSSGTRGKVALKKPMRGSGEKSTRAPMKENKTIL